MSKECDFLVDSPFIRSMIVNDSRYAFNIIDLSGEYEGRLNLMIKATRGISYDRLINMLQKSASESVIDTFILAFYLRDCRHGKGERTLGRKALQWLAINYSQSFSKILRLIPEYGRWDDLFIIFPNAVLLNRMDNYLSKDVDIESFKKLQSVAVKMFASRLQEDICRMQIGSNISLAAKWAPTENDHKDQRFDLVETLCKELGVTKSDYRKKYISPLRRYLKLVENNLRLNQFHTIRYDKMPNMAFQKYFNSFKKKDEVALNLYLKDTTSVVNKTSNMFPHDILREYDIFNANDVNHQIEIKWKYYLENYKNMNIKKTIPVLHTSSSFYKNKTMFLRAVSFALFISRKSCAPFNNLIIRNTDSPFHYAPAQEHVITTLKQLIEYQPESNVDILKVMKMILHNAKQHHLRQEDMPSYLLYICDVDCIKTDIIKSKFASKSVLMQTIQSLFESSGYVAPKIIFFNMNSSSTSFPILSNHQNVGMISGYSPQIMKSILNDSQELFTCKTILQNILYSERYVSLRNLII